MTDEQKPWSDNTASAPAACHVLAAHLDLVTGEWVCAVVATPLFHPFTHWRMLDTPDTRPAPQGEAQGRVEQWDNLKDDFPVNHADAAEALFDLGDKLAAELERMRSLLDEAAGAPGWIASEGGQEETRVARSAITETLAEVERHLSAVQYDPAPYTALKARLAAMQARRRSRA